jgi:hypothetical protein
MAFLNANIPPIECFVRGNYLRDQQDSHDKYFSVLVFGVSSLPGQAPLFNFIMEDGAIWWHAPISAFCKKEGIVEQDLHELELWDSFSYHIAITKFSVLQNKKLKFLSRNGKEHLGTYLFTLDWAHSDFNEINFGFSENPGQHKCGHVIELDNGNFAIQPNNRIRLYDPNFVTKQGENLIERKINSQIYTVENCPKWVSEDNNNYEYKIKEIE